MSFSDASGAQMTLQNYKGQVVLVNAWATWCPPCVAEMPSLNELQKMRGDTSFQVVTISLDRTAEDAQAWLDKKGLDLPGWHDGTYGLNDKAQLPGLPTTILYDRSGREVARLGGDADWASEEALTLIDYLKGQ